MHKTLFYDMTKNGVVVIYHPESSPNAEWDEWVKYLGERASGCSGLVVVVEGDSRPTSGQRSRVLEALSSMPTTTPIVLLTDSALVRGVLTAINWVVGRGKTSATFATVDIDLALEFLSMPVEDQADAKALLQRLQTEAAAIGRQSTAG